MNRKRLLSLAAFLLLCLSAEARQKIQGDCTQGGIPVVTSGIMSTNGGFITDWQQSFPGCTVTVYNQGTLVLSTIYADNSGTPKANPFTSALDGNWFFYADNAHYDIKFSGGGIVTPFTRGDYSLFDPAQNTFFTFQSVTFASSITLDASSANWFQTTLTGNITSLTVNNPATARLIALTFTQDGVGGRTVAFPAAFLNPPIMGTGSPAGSTATFEFYYNGANWICINCDTNNIYGSKIINNAAALTLPTTTDTIVGRATSDTLTNKTLTSPTINAGALSGTFSGTPTFSGQLTSSLATGTAPFSIASTTAVNNLSLGTGSTYPAAGMTGTLTTAQGGTGVGTFTSNGVLYGNGAGNVLVTAAGGAGTQCLNSIGGAAPVWSGCSGIASTAWDTITSPSGNESLSIGTTTTTITGGAIGGSPVTNVWTFKDTTGNTTTGCLLCVNTVGTSTALPFQVTGQGTANGLKIDTGGKMRILGTGSIDTALSTNVAVYDRVTQGFANDNATWGHATTSFTESYTPGDGNTVTFSSPNSGTLNTKAANFTFTTGVGNGTAAAGTLTFSTGSGGANSGNGGSFAFTSGTGGAPNGSGGSYTFTSGVGTGLGTGGLFTFSAGNGGATAGTGGTINISSGGSNGAGISGAINLNTGNSGTTGQSANITMATGNANVTGPITFTTGTATGVNGATGDITFTIGAPTGNGVTGALRVTPGGTNLPSTSSSSTIGSLIPGDGTNSVAGRWLVSEGTTTPASSWHYMGSNLVQNCPFQGPIGALVGNSADQVIFSCTIKGKQILAGKGIRIHIYWKHNVATAAVTYKLNYGGVVVSQIATNDLATNTSGWVESIFNNPGVTNAQTGLLDQITNGTTFIFGAAINAAAIDSTADQTLSFTFNVANTDQVTGQGWYVELVN